VCTELLGRFNQNSLQQADGNGKQNHKNRIGQADISQLVGIVISDNHRIDNAHQPHGHESRCNRQSQFGDVFDVDFQLS